jgi:hypothetical protein
MPMRCPSETQHREAGSSARSSYLPIGAWRRRRSRLCVASWAWALGGGGGPGNPGIHPPDICGLREEAGVPEPRLLNLGVLLLNLRIFASCFGLPPSFGAIGPGRPCRFSSHATSAFWLFPRPWCASTRKERQDTGAFYSRAGASAGSSSPRPAKAAVLSRASNRLIKKAASGHRAGPRLDLHTWLEGLRHTHGLATSVRAFEAQWPPGPRPPFSSGAPGATTEVRAVGPQVLKSIKIRT